MKLIIFINLYSLVDYFCFCEEIKKMEKYNNEDQQMLTQSIVLFGNPRTSNDLRGLEFNKDKKEKTPLVINFTNDNEGNYSFKYYGKISDFPYLERYEMGELKEAILKVKGQYSEIFERTNGSYYIRTIGYTADETGYNPFLLDLSTLTIETKIEGPLVDRTGKPKTGISSTVLITLTGGNTG